RGKPAVFHHFREVIQLVQIRKFHRFKIGTLRLNIMIYSRDRSKFILALMFNASLTASRLAIASDGESSCLRKYLAFTRRRAHTGWAMVFQCVRYSAIAITARR